MQADRGARARAIALVGPTASGKSALAAAIGTALSAHGLTIEILCCDSMQVYRGMDIGTAKPGAAERAAWIHHGLDLVTPAQHFHAAAWAQHARAALAAIAARARVPLIVGGTGLYLRALVRGLFDAPPPDPEIRARHQAEAQHAGVPALHARLAQVDPEIARRIAPADFVRTSRALEIYEQTGTPMSVLRKAAKPPGNLELLTIVLDPARETLRSRILERTHLMLDRGLVDEVRGLRAAGYGRMRALQAIGYREVGMYLDQGLSVGGLVDAIAHSTMAYARRQRTWFRGEPGALRVSGLPDASALMQAILSFWRAR